MARLGSDFGRTWVRLRSDLGQTWVRLGSDLGQTWVRLESDLGRTWVGHGSDMGRNWVRIGSGAPQAKNKIELFVSPTLCQAKSDPTQPNQKRSNPAQPKTIQAKPSQKRSKPTPSRQNNTPKKPKFPFKLSYAKTTQHLEGGLGKTTMFADRSYHTDPGLSVSNQILISPFCCTHSEHYGTT